MRFIYQFLFNLAGWKISGDVPRNTKKYLIIAAPHSSNWDFMLGISVRNIMRFKSNFLGKKELFRFPLGWLFRSLGGYPVDRGKNSNVVDQVVNFYNTEEEFVIALAPEGTRKNVDRWKTGFYHIAVKAKVPIVMVGLDWASKTVIFREAFYPTGDFNEDSKVITEFYSKVKGRFRSVAPIT